MVHTDTRKRPCVHCIFAYFSDFLLVILRMIPLVSFCIFPCCLPVSERKQSKSVTLSHLYQSASSCQYSCQSHIQVVAVWKFVKFLSALSSADPWWRGCVVSHIGSRWRWMVSFTLRPLYTQSKLYRVLGCPGAGALKKRLQDQNGTRIAQSSRLFLIITLLRLLVVQTSVPNLRFESFLNSRTAAGLRIY
jgi:hypothetical protein